MVTRSWANRAAPRGVSATCWKWRGKMSCPFLGSLLREMSVDRCRILRLWYDGWGLESRAEQVGDEKWTVLEAQTLWRISLGVVKLGIYKYYRPQISSVNKNYENLTAFFLKSIYLFPVALWICLCPDILKIPNAMWSEYNKLLYTKCSFW